LSTKIKWNSLDYWKSGEWQVVMERLHDLRKHGLSHCPERRDLFNALKATPFEAVRVAIIGQDPYPNPDDATGIAFSVREDRKPYPASLGNIFTEYHSDLGYPYPTSGSLTPWCEQGVLLWNAYPSCEKGKPGSHHWDEWIPLTQEIVEKLDGRENHVVFVFLGRAAASFSKYVNSNVVITTSHPSTLSANKGFIGSKIFTRINSYLGNNPINWRLT
jgi:uracil-DNA glycosylase